MRELVNVRKNKHNRMIIRISKVDEKLQYETTVQSGLMTLRIFYAESLMVRYENVKGSEMPAIKQIEAIAQSVTLKTTKGLLRFRSLIHASVYL